LTVVDDSVVAKLIQIWIYFNIHFAIAFTQSPVNPIKVQNKGNEVTAVMHNRERIPTFVALSLFFLPVCAPIAWAQTPLKPVDAPQGATIVYGVMDGAHTQAAAIGKMLRDVHNSCGEKPQIGKVFKVRGTNSNAVFFTVVNHPRGNRQVAGLVIAAQSGPHLVEAALVADDASRFDSTVNPMLQRLFNAWHPGGEAASGSSASGSAGGGHSAGPATLHRVAASDNTASVGVPDGWQAKGKEGTMMISGPHGEEVGLDLVRMAVDSGAYGRPNNAGKIVYPYNADLTRAFPDIFQQYWRLNGANPTGLRIDHAEPMPGSPGERCVHATGHVTLIANFPQEMNALLCTGARLSTGSYLVMLSVVFIPTTVADQERATAGAILASFEVNQAVLQGQVAAMSAPLIGVIHQIGKDAAARAAATDKANQAQHEAWNADQDIKARNSQGFSNYLLDQTVIQDNKLDAHGTVWNSTANAMVKADPNRFEIVDTPNYWKGIDY
jgi:hypothetical protein